MVQRTLNLVCVLDNYQIILFWYNGKIKNAMQKSFFDAQSVLGLLLIIVKIFQQNITCKSVYLMNF